MQKILIMGLPGSGKTTLAKNLVQYLKHKNYSVEWINADVVRTKFNDWDFSYEGRARQSLRMAELALKSTCDYVVCDFIAPTSELRNNFNADYIVWMDTINKSRFQDTNELFIPPNVFDYRVSEFNAEVHAPIIGSIILG